MVTRGSTVFLVLWASRQRGRCQRSLSGFTPFFPSQGFPCSPFIPVPISLAIGNHHAAKCVIHEESSFMKLKSDVDVTSSSSILSQFKTRGKYQARPLKIKQSDSERVGQRPQCFITVCSSPILGAKHIVRSQTEISYWRGYGCLMKGFSKGLALAVSCSYGLRIRLLLGRYPKKKNRTESKCKKTKNTSEKFRVGNEE